MTVSQDDFVDIVLRNNYDTTAILAEIKQTHPTYTVWPGQVETRIANYVKQGKLPLQTSGNTVSPGEILKGTTTTYDSSGNIVRQSVRTEVPKASRFDAIAEAIRELAKESIAPLPEVSSPPMVLDEHMMNLIISTDVHMGLFVTADDSETDWNTDKMVTRLKSAYDYLFDAMPKAKTAIIVDLGDSLESPDDKNMTRKSGNILDVDGKHARNLRAVYKSFIYAIEKALETHDIVYFYNVEGNHEAEQAVAIREIILNKFEDNPRVIVDDTSHLIKYHQHGKVLLQFFHGDRMKPRQAGEAMAVDRRDIFSITEHRFSHYGHVHADKLYDGAITKVESHRHLAPNNSWAYAHGYRRNLGTMKVINYHSDHGEVGRQIYNVSIEN